MKKNGNDCRLRLSTVLWIQRSLRISRVVFVDVFRGRLPDSLNPFQASSGGALQDDETTLQ